MYTIKQVLTDAVAKLNNEEATIEARILLEKTLAVNSAWLISHAEDSVDLDTLSLFEALIQRRVNGEPIAYILGEREFFGLNLKVTPDTLIPRSDTETLVETALAKIPDDQPSKVLDLGTGTGAIAIAIARHKPNADVMAVDLSAAALDIAMSNVHQLAISNVTCVQSDWFNALDAMRFDVIVSNPPYIEVKDQHLKQGDLRFEPISALVSGEDGLSDIRIILKNVLVYLKPQGWVMLEHGYLQGPSVQELMAEAGLVDIETIQDLAGNDRVTIAKNSLIVSAHWRD